MSEIKKKSLIISSAIVAAVIILVDQITKVIVRHKIPVNSNISIINNFFDLVNVTNKGIAFGMLDKFSSNQYKLFILMTILSIAVLFYFYISFIKTPQHNKFIIYALAGIIGGAFGNFIDRLMLGYVTDFLLIYYRNFQWPAFNFADTCISVGAIGLIVYLIYHFRYQKKKYCPVCNIEVMFKTEEEKAKEEAAKIDTSTAKGKVLEKVEKVKKQSKTEKKAEKQFCEFCGSQVPSSASVCPSCNTKLNK